MIPQPVQGQLGKLWGGGTLNPVPWTLNPSPAQGQLGKFGNVELSDVVAFLEMPDGKVLSSTESGEMLMWDGGLIKV